MKNIAVLASGGGTNLQALLDAEARGELKSGRVTLVISSDPEAYALERARGAGIEAVTIPRKGYKRETFTHKIVTALQARDIGLVVFAGFMCILSPEFCENFPNMAINIHPALIPAFCGVGFYGLRVHEAALEYGVKLTGATVHFVTPETDGGPIILQKAIEIPEGVTAAELQRLVMEKCEWALLPRAAELYCAGRLTVEGRTVRINAEIRMQNAEIT